MSDHQSTTGPPPEQETYYDVQCDRCKALHPLRQAHGNALTCMDRLNNSRRPCPSCGAVERWVLLAAVPPPCSECDRKDRLILATASHLAAASEVLGQVARRNGAVDEVNRLRDSLSTIVAMCVSGNVACVQREAETALRWREGGG